MNAKTCHVAILRPPEVKIETLHGPTLDVSEKLYGNKIEEIMREIRTLVVTQANDLGVSACVTEYQIHDTSGKGIMSPKRTKQIGNEDVIVTINPTPKEFSFVSQLTIKPNNRGIIAFTEKEQLENMAQIMNSTTLLILERDKEEITYKSIPRTFALVMPLNSEQRASYHEQNLRAVSCALQFPNIPIHNSTPDRFTSIYIPPAGSRESLKEFQTNI